ncbi:hypothetical protein ACYOEI_01080 [Singulisphaera rosea]
MVGKVFLDLVDKKSFVKGPCPMMDFSGGKVRCGVVLAEERCNLKPVTAEALGIGKGCCADDPRAYDHD